jgi:hypothetical protein
MAVRVWLKKISGRVPQRAWSQDELIGGKPPVVSNTHSDSDGVSQPVSEELVRE